jgi:hypothetical protein
MGVFQNNLLAGAAAAASAGGGAFYSYQIEQSCRFDSGSSSTLSKTWGSAASDGTKMSWSVWTKKASNGGSLQLISANDTYTGLLFLTNTASDQLYFQVERESNTSSPQAAVTNAQYRDNSGWYHILWTGDASQSGADQQKIYVNGTRITSFSTDVLAARAMSSSDTFSITRNGKQASIGVRSYNNSNYYNGYMAEIICVDGQAKSPTDFGETKNGVWIPIDYSGTYGNNGYRLKFENASDLGNDSSGNNNDFTANNMGADHQVLDSPTFGS